MKILTVKNYKELSNLAAKVMANQINKKPNSVLGFATGSTPIGTYKKLIEMNKKKEIDFSHVVSFNLDEYCGLQKRNPQSYYHFMMENLFKHININKRNVHIPNGMAESFEEECKHYEKQIKKAGGIDLQLLGVGQNGHIGFNEPDELFYNKTRQVRLTESTINANKRFFTSAADVPKTAVSMGIGTIMEAKEVILIAGADKAEIVKNLKKEVVYPQFPVSVLHYHPCCTVIFCNSN